ncbi:MAG TPA: tRNA (adenosine(37)-N6)-threonylcarbamoyltransferase complex dimerization subunit type 1 TsaB [Candidatus Limnocylindria bacterium]|nr:tRNA (adenosine(37)-N6)-threonylcarbamoyltransferase complex dimerization subunit type 1 TsaB [Candidatus Limnocylindria bacterium]
MALDTSSPAGSLAILRGEKVIGVVSTWAEETYSARMFRHLDFLLRELSLDLKQFDLFTVAAGPGSFTGLRVGLTAVKGWAEAYKKPAAGVSGLEALAVQAHSTVPLLIPVLDARRGQIYFGFYRRSENGLALEGQECVMTPGEFLETLHSRAADTEFTIVTPESEFVSKQLSQIEKRAPSVEQVSSVLAPLIGQLGYRRAQRGQISDALSLDANYVRRTDAELHWKVP